MGEPAEGAHAGHLRDVGAAFPHAAKAPAAAANPAAGAADVPPRPQAVPGEEYREIEDDADHDRGAAGERRGETNKTATAGGGFPPNAPCTHGRSPQASRRRSRDSDRKAGATNRS